MRWLGERDQLEYPAGTVVAKADAPGGGFSFVRVSPRGDAVAAFELQASDSLSGRVVIVDRCGTKRAVSAPYLK